MRRRTRRFGGLTTMVTLAVIVMGGCGGEEEETADRPAGEETTSITVARAATGLPFIPLDIAEQRGFFEDHDLEVEVIQASGENSVAALRSGQAEFMVTAPELAIGARARGARLKMIGAVIDQSLFRLCVTEDIETVDDLAGEKVSVHVRGAGPLWFQTRYVLEERGAGAEESTFVTGQLPPARFAALREGQVSGGLLIPPFDVAAERQGLPCIVAMSDLIENYPNIVVSASEQTLDDKPDVARRLMRAMLDATSFAAAHPDLSVDIAAETLGGQRPVLAEAFARMQPALTEDGEVNAEALDFTLGLMRRYGEFESLPAANQVYDPSFLP